jgi:GNAT superfamily N-acetyltransferase
MAWFCEGSRIVKVFYPVFPPDRNAAAVLHWMEHRRLFPPGRVDPAPGPFTIRPIEPRDLTWIRAELVRNWTSTTICSRGRWFDADALPGFVAIADNGVDRIGLLTHTPLPGEPGGDCEVITLSTIQQGRGAGAALLERAVRAARAAGCRRLFLTTSNDNLNALRFYQKRGWRIVAVHPGMIDFARATHAAIPLVGEHGVPLRDEIELEMRLDPAPPVPPPFGPCRPGASLDADRLAQNREPSMPG